MVHDVNHAMRLEAFASFLHRFVPVVKQSEVEDIMLAARRIRELTPPEDLPEASRSSHYSG